MERCGGTIVWTLAAALPLASPALAGPFDGPYRPEAVAMPHLRTCDAHGPGFAALPGSGACVRVGGRVRAEAGTGLRPEAGPIRASGRLSVDVRPQTDYGPARAFVRLRAGQP